MFSEQGKVKVWQLLLVASVASFFLLKGFPIVAPGANNPADPGAQIVKVTPDGSNPNLQIKTLTLITPNPTTTHPIPVGNACAHDVGVPITEPCDCSGAWKITCEARKCVKAILPAVANPNNVEIECNSIFNNWCNIDSLAPTNGTFCIGKPIIYLYPEKPTRVDVSIKTSGNIFVSIPEYPESGWKNILAHPDGKLFYEGSIYRELFYETNVKDIQPPKNGIVIPTDQTEQQLLSILTKLGLTPWEKQEFLTYWIPRLKNLKSPYILFSLIESQEKSRIDNVIVKPEPDTRIEFLAYFKPLQKPIEISLLKLPENPPQRKGFTMVEWGGTIER